MTRPYRNFMEMAKDAHTHNKGKIIFLIKDKEDERSYSAFLGCEGVVIPFTTKENRYVAFDYLAKQFTWADGSPCGVVEGEKE